MFTSLGIVLLLDYNTSEVKPPKVHVKIRIYPIHLDAEKLNINMLPVLTCYTLMHLWKHCPSSSKPHGPSKLTWVVLRHFNNLVIILIYFFSRSLSSLTLQRGNHKYRSLITQNTKRNECNISLRCWGVQFESFYRI